MKTVYIEQDGKPIGYAVGRLGLDHIIRQAQSAQLLPYISHLCAESDKPSIAATIGKLQVVPLTALEGSEEIENAELKSAFVFEGVPEEDKIELLNKIAKLCLQHLTEKLIVEQPMGPGPTLHHRVLKFATIPALNVMIAMFVCLGENTFDYTVSEIERRYPEASRA